MRRLLPLLLLSLSACSGTSSPTAATPATAHVTTEAPTATPTSPATPTPTATPTPSAAATASPTATAARTASPTPRATVSPAPRRTPAPAIVVATDRTRRVFPVQGCSASYGHTHHDYPATDIFAARGCSVVAPVAGRVDEVSTVDRWTSSTNRGADRGGISWSIVGVDGVRYYGSHLESLTVRAGQRVVAGQVLGKVGDTGSARGTGTHLHFGLSWPTRPGIWWVRRGEVYPWPYLDSWRAGGSKSPAAEVAASHRRQGDVPPCTSYC